VKFRTLAGYPLTGAVQSHTETLAGILEEIILSQDLERQGRVIDFDHAASMEKKKHEGFF
jgi:sulfate adenylyltransferase subunit 2